MCWGPGLNEKSTSMRYSASSLWTVWPVISWSWCHTKNSVTYIMSLPGWALSLNCEQNQHFLNWSGVIHRNKSNIVWHQQHSASPQNFISLHVARSYLLPAWPLLSSPRTCYSRCVFTGSSSGGCCLCSSTSSYSKNSGLGHSDNHNSLPKAFTS